MTTRVTHRRLSREAALKALFQCEYGVSVGGEEPSEKHLQDIFATYSAHFPMDPEARDYAWILFSGVVRHLPEIDARVTSVAQHWKIDRMALVDRTVMRLAIFEMLFAAETIKPAVVIDEAVELARRFGSADSHAFVNGVLDAIVKQHIPNPGVE